MHMGSGILKTATIRGLRTGWLEFKPEAGSPTNAASIPNVVMIHGYPDTPESYSFQSSALGQHCNLVVPYVRGIGPSEPASKVSRYGLDAVALDIMEIIAHAGWGVESKVHLVGHDLGALYAWHLASLLGKRLQSVTIMGGLGMPQARHRFGDLRQLRKSWYIFGMQLPVLPKVVLGFNPERFLRSAFRAGGLLPAARPDHVQAGIATKDLVTTPINQYRALFQDGLFFREAAHPALQAPVMVIHGSRDQFVLPPALDEFKSSAVNVSVNILEGNHWIHRENPDRVNALLKKFIDTNSRT